MKPIIGALWVIGAIAALFAGENSAWGVTVSKPVKPYVFNKDLRTLPPVSGRPATHQEHPQRIKPGFQPIRPRPPGAPDPLWRQGKGAGNRLAGLSGPPPFPFTPPSPNFDTTQSGDGPPDANGAVGPNHYVQIVNSGPLFPTSTFEIFDKSGNLLSGPTDLQTLWSSAPANDDCLVRGRGDPYVLYDHLADRWVVSQLANHLTTVGNPLMVQCIAVSRGPNPVTDGFNAYTFQLGVANDFPKLAVWPDAYYMISQEGYDSTNPNLDAWAFDRTNMLAGNPATFLQQNTAFHGEHDVIALPSQLTGAVPPAGSPNFFVRPYDGNLYADGVPRIEIYEFHADFVTPALTTFNLVQTITPATFRSDICNGTGLNQNCVPQPGTATRLDALSIWTGGPLQYRNFGDHETLLFSHAINADGAGLVGIRWHELRRSPVGSGSWTLFQEGTFAPPDPGVATTSIYRWTSSIAMDKAGNIALGYNASNDGIAPHATVFPSIRVVGRLSTDPLGTFTTSEVELATGGGSNGGSRWGDYSAMRVDPTDDCTFWYTTEYVAATGQQTHVGALRFPACNPADLAVTKTGPATAFAGSQVSYSVNVTNNGPSDATNVVVTDTLPAGTALVSTTCPGGTLPCNLGNLTNGASTSFSITISIPANFLSSMGVTSKTISNTASVSSDQFDPNSGNDTSTANTLVTGSADLALTKTCATTNSASSSCDIQITNNGPSDAQNVVVTDAIKTSRLTFKVTSVSGATCTPAPPVGPVHATALICNLGTVASGATMTIHVTFGTIYKSTVNDAATVVSTTPDPNSGNNSATGSVKFQGHGERG
jgi:uncharacterized repeat protein (TIGR01451 family)